MLVSRCRSRPRAATRSASATISSWYGTARLEEGGGPELLQRLAEVYLGPGVKFPPFDNPPPGHVIRITADRVAGIGPWSAAT